MKRRYYTYTADLAERPGQVIWGCLTSPLDISSSRVIVGRSGCGMDASRLLRLKVARRASIASA